MNRVSRITADVLSTLGLRRATRDWFPRALIGFSAGVLTGAAAALVLTPKTGEQMRDDLRVGAGRLVKKGRAQLQGAASAIAGTARDLKEKVNERIGHHPEVEPERHPIGV